MKRNLDDWLNGLGVDMPEVHAASAAPEENSGAELMFSSQANDLPHGEKNDEKTEKAEKINEAGDNKAGTQDFVAGLTHDLDEHEEIEEIEENYEHDEFDKVDEVDVDLVEVDKVEAEEGVEAGKNEENDEFEALIEAAGTFNQPDNAEQPHEDKNKNDAEGRTDGGVKNKKNKFLTEQDELQNLADALLLDDKKTDEIQPEVYNYSLEEIQQLEDYVEQLESLLDEKESILRDEIANSISRENQANNGFEGATAGNKDYKIKNDEKLNREIENGNAVKNENIKNNNDGKNYADDAETDINARINTALNIGNSAESFQEIVVRERDSEFTQKLHGALHNRKVLSIEKTENVGRAMAGKPRRRFRLAVLCAVLLALALAFAFGTLMYLKKRANLNLNLNNNSVNIENNAEKIKGNAENIKSENVKNKNFMAENVKQAGNNENDENLNKLINLDKISGDNLILNVKSDDTLINKSESSDSININKINKKVSEPVTYEKYIEAGSRALGKKSWDEAILNFHSASQLDSRDIKPMIGLAGAYYEKGMFFDSLRIINEIRAKFPFNTTVDFMRRTLRGVR